MKFTYILQLRLPPRVTVSTVFESSEEQLRHTFNVISYFRRSLNYARLARRKIFARVTRTEDYFIAAPY